MLILGSYKIKSYLCLVMSVPSILAGIIGNWTIIDNKIRIGMKET